MNSLDIAAGTEWQSRVYDVRELGKWARATMHRGGGPPSSIVVHHTGPVPSMPTLAGEQIYAMEQAAPNWPYGIAYNFLLFPGGRCNVYYVNDVDWCWPHTLNANCATAIGVWGDWRHRHLPRRPMRRLKRLIGALRSMWDAPVPVAPHWRYTGTECPGTIWPDLVASGFPLSGK